MQTKAQKRAQAKYDAKMKAQYIFRLNREKDKDILDRLASVPSKQAYIRELILKDIRG